MFLSTHQVAKKLGISVPSLYRYIEQKKISAPQAVRIGSRDVRSWTEADIEHARKLLPKIANGRKTRYKKQSAISDQQSAKPRPQPGAAVPHKQSKPRKAHKPKKK